MSGTDETTEVVVIGGGQAGLAMSRCLTEFGVPHLVLERGRVGERWRSERWPTLRLLTPAWMTRLPGFTLPGIDPASFMGSSAFVLALERYATLIGAPLRTGTEVRSVRAIDQGYAIMTSCGRIKARAVVIATGACDVPDVPDWARNLPDHIHQVTPDRFRRAALLPVGGVLVVGASATGVQLAQTIATSGRAVTLAVGSHVRAPRRYRGRDLFEWLDASGFLAEPRRASSDHARLRAQPSLPLTGGGAIDLGGLSAMGVRLVGRAIGAAGGVVRFADTLPAEVQRAEDRRRGMLARIDAYIAQSGHHAPADPEAWQDPPALPPAPLSLDLAASDVRTVVWATGYRRSYPWLQVPVLDSEGEIMTQGCETPVPGLYALGLPFQRQRSSALIDGVGRDAEALSRSIVRHLGRHRRLAA